MPTYISKEGEWYPAKEVAHAIKNNTGKTLTHDWIVASDGSHTVQPGDQFTYNGPDREAIKALAAADVKHFGHNFRNDPEFLQGIRNMNFQSVEDYLKAIGYDGEKAKKEADKKADTTITHHDMPKRAKEIKTISGGRSTAGDFIGGFGDERLRDSKELAQQPATK